MLRRREMMGAQKTEPYEMLTYIEATGTQYIDTGYNVEYNQPFSIELDYQSLKQSGTEFQSVFGLTTTDSSSAGISAAIFSANALAYNWALPASADHGNGTAISNTNISYGSRDIWKLNRYEFSVKGTNNYTFAPNDYLELKDRSIYLFARNQNNLEARALATGRLYYCKMWYNDVLVRDFVPVRRRSDGAIGLYDNVTDAFFGNAGTGSFIGG